MVAKRKGKGRDDPKSAQPKRLMLGLSVHVEAVAPLVKPGGHCAERGGGRRVRRSWASL